MEYIECTHCGKRYAVNDKIRSSEGDFAKCKNCHEKFMLVIRDSEKQGIEEDEDKFNATTGWDPTLTIPPATTEDDNAIGDWDPSLTMPEPERASESEEVSELSEEEIQAQAEATLAAIQQEKKKKMITYILLGGVVFLLVFVLYISLADPESETLNQSVSQAQSKVKKVLAADADKANALCREAAAKQWWIDYKAMHENYSAADFVALLEENEAQNAKIKEHCKNPLLLQSIIRQATAKEKPEWLSAEIQAFQK